MYLAVAAGTDHAFTPQAAMHASAVFHVGVRVARDAAQRAAQHNITRVVSEVLQVS